MSQVKKTIIVIDSGLQHVIDVDFGSNLLETLRKMGKGISAPCNGRGTCRKCTVEIEGLGMVSSCDFTITSDIVVNLPVKGKAQILQDTTTYHADSENDSGLTAKRTNDCYRLWYTDLELCTVSDPSSPMFGIAVDIGTTTVVAFLVDLKRYAVVDVVSFVNPQTQYGHDVVSRIQHTMVTPDGLRELHNIFMEKLNADIENLYKKNGIAAELVYKMTVVGNPTMLHILLRVDPQSIASAPYTPAFTDKKVLKAEEIGCAMNSKGVVIVLPSVSGYVGADITAGIATTSMTRSDETSLFIDIGTNGEMALCKGEKLYCCATAAGPAFEGALIQCGVGGIEGAISHFDDIGYKTIGDKAPVGICGSGLIDIVAYCIRNGIIDQTGYMENDFLLVKGSDTSTGTDIVLTPQDVRQVQLAKAAIFAGIKVLMSEAGCTYEDIDHLYLGGAFGSYMNIESAAALGLIPCELREKVIVTGNVAGRGSLSSLMSELFVQRVESIAQKAQYIELSTHPGFMDQYVMSMGFENELGVVVES